MNRDMNSKKALRLVYPQWQGGKIDHWITEIKNPEDSSRGYFLGARLLNFLAPGGGQKTVEVPISLEAVAREPVDGVLDRDVIAKQTRAALEILRAENPEKIVTLGGECSVSVVPFSYLAQKYGGDVAVVWIDAHPDITLPGDAYSGYHAMAVTALMGDGDGKILSALPAKIPPSRILLAGIRNWERDEIRERQERYGIKHLAREEFGVGFEAVRDWLKSCGASKVLVHFDMDVLDPAEIVAAVGTDPDGMSIDSVVGLINAIASEKELVGLTVAEPMPRTAIRIKNMLDRLPLLK